MVWFLSRVRYRVTEMCGFRIAHRSPQVVHLRRDHTSPVPVWDPADLLQERLAKQVSHYCRKTHTYVTTSVLRSVIVLLELVSHHHVLRLMQVRCSLGIKWAWPGQAAMASHQRHKRSKLCTALTIAWPTQNTPTKGTHCCTQKGKSLFLLLPAEVQLPALCWLWRLRF